MPTIRRAEDRGHANHGWLDTHHTFSFADYYDPAHMGFRALPVINEGRVAPGRGFGAHPHRDMEIVTVVLSGVLEHRDSTGTAGRLRPGEVQRMSAGTGVVHSEMNVGNQELHFLQIWILPWKSGLPPSYEQKAFPLDERRGRLCLLVSPDGAEDSLTISQDVRLYATLLELDQRVAHELSPGRHAWVQMMRGRAWVDGVELSAGDGAAFSDVGRLEIHSELGAEALLFDLA